jgi:hypothetical protein
MPAGMHVLVPWLMTSTTAAWAQFAGQADTLSLVYRHGCAAVDADC